MLLDVFGRCAKQQWIKSGAMLLARPAAKSAWILECQATVRFDQVARTTLSTALDTSKSAVSVVLGGCCCYMPDPLAVQVSVRAELVSCSQNAAVST